MTSTCGGYDSYEADSPRLALNQINEVMNISIITIGIDEIIANVDAYTSCGYTLITRHEYLYKDIDYSKYNWITLVFQKSTDNHMLGIWVK